MAILKKIFFALLIFSIIGLFAANVRGQDEQEEQEVDGEQIQMSEEEMRAAIERAQAEAQLEAEAQEQENNTETQQATNSYSAPDVQTSYIFPDHPNLKFKFGEVIEVLLGFHNLGDQVYNVSIIGAELKAPNDFSYSIQNFTRFGYNTLVKPNEQGTFAYYFRPDLSLNPSLYGLSVSVYYIDEAGRYYVNYFFNSTFTIVEDETTVNTEFLFTIVAGVAILGLIGFGFSKLNIPNSKSKKRAIEYGTTKRENVDANEWLEGLVDIGKKKKSSKSPSRGKKASS